MTWAQRKEAVISGFGHRVYRNVDPRSRIIRKVAGDVFAVTGKNAMLEIALKLHDVALADKYFTERKLFPNVDFFSGAWSSRCLIRFRTEDRTGLIYQSLGVVRCDIRS